MQIRWKSLWVLRMFLAPRKMSDPCLPFPPPDCFHVSSLRWSLTCSSGVSCCSFSSPCSAAGSLTRPLCTTLCKLFLFFSFFYVSWWTYFDPLSFFWLTYPGGMYALPQLYKSKKPMKRGRDAGRVEKREGWFRCHYLRGGIEEPKSPKCLAVWLVSNTTHKTLRF